MLRSMSRMDARFNGKYRYPYIFLNNDPFSAEFVNRHVLPRLACAVLSGCVVPGYTVTLCA